MFNYQGMEYDKPSDCAYVKVEDEMYKIGFRLAGDRTSSLLEVTSNYRPNIGEEISAHAFQAGDAKVGARFVGADYGVKHGTHAETFDGAEVKARLTLGEVKTGPAELHLGLGVTTGATVEDGTLGVKAAGCGFKVGKKIGVSVLDNEFSVDPLSLVGKGWL